MNYEGRGTEMAEEQTARVPSLAFLGFAVGAMAVSAALVLSGRKQLGNFIGQWAPTILIMGVYNKLAKEVAVPKRHGYRGYAAEQSMGAGSEMSGGI